MEEQTSDDKSFYNSTHIAWRAASSLALLGAWVIVGAGIAVTKCTKMRTMPSIEMVRIILPKLLE